MLTRRYAEQPNPADVVRRRLPAHRHEPSLALRCLILLNRDLRRFSARQVRRVRPEMTAARGAKSIFDDLIIENGHLPRVGRALL